MVKSKFKRGEHVRIKSGKFRGVRGRISHIEREKDKYYYEIYTDDPWHKGGLAYVINIRENNLAKVKRIYKK